MNRRLLTMAGLTLAAAFIFVAATLVGLRTERGARIAIEIFGDVSGYHIGMRTLQVSGWRWTAEDLHVANGGGAVLFRAGRVTVEITPTSLLRGRLRSVALHAFELDLAQVPAGGGEPTRLPFADIEASDGVVLHVSAALDEVRIPEIVFARRREQGGFDIRGKLESGSDLEITWEGSAAANGDDLAVRVEGTLRHVARVMQPTTTPRTDASSTLTFDADVSGSLRRDLHATSDAELSVPGLRVPLRVALALARSGTTGETTYEGDVTADGVAAPLKVAGVFDGLAITEKIDASASWRDLDLAEAAALLVDRSRFDARTGRLTLDASAEGALGAPAFKVALEVKNLSVTSSGLHVAGNGALSFAHPDGALTSRDAELALDDLAISTSGLTASVKRLRAEPRLDVGSPTRSLRLEKLATVGIAFADGTNELQGLGIEVLGRLEFSLDGDGRRSATLAWSAPRGELLYKRAYLDVSASPAEGSARVTPNGSGLTGEVAVALESLGELRADGDYDDAFRRKRLHVEAKVPRLRAPFEKLVRDTFADAYPVLARTSLDGAASIDIELRTTESGTTASGVLRVSDVAFDVADPSIHGKGIALNLPIALSTASEVGTKPLLGTIRIGEAAFGDAAIGAIDLPLTVRTNEIASVAPLRVLVARGVVLINGMRARALASEAPSLEARVTLENLDLGDLTSAAGLPRVDGRVHGPLGLVQLADGHLATDAAIDVAVFGGNVYVSAISIDDLFSRVPALGFDAALSRIDLGKATEAIGLGYVSGIAEGQVKDLEIAGGAPVRFDAHVETVPVSGVSQRISVTAIDQLAVLGGGSSGSLARGMMGLFDEYRYAKLGFRCSLSNDRFVLRGVTEHDGKDFLVVGTIFPPSVNVVSHNPVIAFSEMVERLQRITSASTPEPQDEGAGEQQ